jgi:hypothetical protein
MTETNSGTNYKPIENALEAITRGIVWTSGTRDAGIVERMQAALTAMARQDGFTEDEIEEAVVKANEILAGSRRPWWKDPESVVAR